MPTSDDLAHLLHGVDTLLPEDALAARLEEGRPLRVKLGLDPTAPAVTLGWAVVLRKLRHFQELGHTAVLIVGDFTAQVGDPSGKSETRRRLSEAEVRGYAETILEEFSKVLLPEPLEIRYNSEWLGGMDMTEVLELTSHVTVAQMLERDDFAKRFAGKTPISLTEFLYPLLQGMDSVAIDADIELGGTDQLFNLMMGRVLQQRYGKRPQLALTMPLLVGTDGEAKMSQSLDNYIGVSDAADDMFGKVMSIPDHLMPQWYELAADVGPAVTGEVVAGLADGSLHPGDAKRRLGRTIVDLYHGAGAGVDAEAAFDLVFRAHEIPDDVAEADLPEGDPVFLPAALSAAGLVASNGEGRRMLQQGAVKVAGEKFTEFEAPRAALAGRVVQVGKRRFVRFRD